MGFRGRAVALVETAAPTAAIDIGDPFITGGAGLAADAQHQHAFPAPPAGYVTDIGDLLVDGSDTSPARADHAHRHQASDHEEGGFADLTGYLSSFLATDFTGLFGRVDAANTWEAAQTFKSGPTFDVKGYGAVGDGAADDTASINAAITAANGAGGGVVFFPAGTYLVSGSILLKARVALVAAAPRTVTIKVATALSAGWTGLLQGRGSVSQLAGVSLSGLIIDANNTTTPCLSLGGVVDFVARDCWFKGTGPDDFGIGTVHVAGGSTSNFAALNSERITFERCEFSNGDAGLAFLGASGGADDTVTLKDVVVDRCYFHDNHYDGIKNSMAVYRAIQNVRISRCRFENNGLVGGGSQYGHIGDTGRTGWVGLDVWGCFFGAGNSTCGGVADHAGRGIRIHHNHFAMNADIWPVALGESRDLSATQRTFYALVTDNFFDHCGSFDFDSSRHVVIARNIFYRNYHQALASFGQHFDTVIEGNHFIECGQSGGGTYNQAAVSCSRGHTIRNNVFRDDQGSPTMLYGVYEIAGDPDEGQGTNFFDDNKFVNLTPLHMEPTYVHKIRRNEGYNPLGHSIAQPAIPASTAAQTNTTGSDCTVYVTAGAGTCAVTIGDAPAGTLPAGTVGTFEVQAGQWITLTYTAAPTWEWFGD